LVLPSSLVVAILATASPVVIAFRVGAKFDQLGEAALVAAAAGGDAAQQPMLLLLELGIELGGVLGLLGGNTFGPFLEAAKADFSAAQRAAIEPQAVFRVRRVRKVRSWLIATQPPL
jgi:hypothetical protein